MKLQLTQHNETYTIESEDEDTFGADMIEYMHNLLLAAGYHRNTIKEAFFDKADELGAEEGWCMQPNPSGAPTKEKLPSNERVYDRPLRSSFEDERFLEEHAIEVKSRYGEPRYFYPIDNHTILYNFFDIEASGMNSDSNGGLYSIDPSGGPFISVGTNLQRDISEILPDGDVKSIGYDEGKGAYVIKL